MDATQDVEFDDDIRGDTTADEREEIGKLVTVEHKHFPRTEFPIYDGANVIGRSEDSDICIKVQSLSKKHACVEHSYGFCVIYDCGSRNKTKKGRKMTLKPNVHYELTNGNEIMFGDVVCKFSLLDRKDNDETGSLTASEASTNDQEETGKEDTINVHNKVENKHICTRETSPSLLKDNDEPSSIGLDTSGILLATQNYVNKINKGDNDDSPDSFQEELKHISTNAKIEDAYAEDTDTDADSEIEEKAAAKNASTTNVVGQTPGFSQKMKNIETPKNGISILFDDNGMEEKPSAALKGNSDAKTQESEGLCSVSTRLELLLDASPNPDPILKDNLSCSFSEELAKDDRFADTLPVGDGQDFPRYSSSDMSSQESSISIKKILKEKEEQYADTVLIENSDNREESKSKEEAEKVDKTTKEEDEHKDDEEYLGTYVFDTDGFDATNEEEEEDIDEDESSGDDQNQEDLQTKKKQEDIKNSHINKTDSTEELGLLSSEELSIPFHKNYCTSTRLMESFHSFGTPASSVHNDSRKHISSAEVSKTEKHVVSDSDEEATQPYEMNSPLKLSFKTTPKESRDGVFAVPLPPSNEPIKVSLPGAFNKARKNSFTEVKVNMETPKIANSNVNTRAPSPVNIDEVATQDFNAATQDFNAATQDFNAATQDFNATIQDFNAATQDFNAATQCYGYAINDDKEECDDETQAYGDMETQAYVEANARTQAFFETEVQTQAYGLEIDDGDNEKASAACEEDLTDNSVKPPLSEENKTGNTDTKPVKVSRNNTLKSKQSEPQGAEEDTEQLSVRRSNRTRTKNVKYSERDSQESARGKGKEIVKTKKGRTTTKKSETILDLTGSDTKASFAGHSCMREKETTDENLTEIPGQNKAENIQIRITTPKKHNNDVVSCKPSIPTEVAEQLIESVVAETDHIEIVNPSDGEYIKNNLEPLETPSRRKRPRGKSNANRKDQNTEDKISKYKREDTPATQRETQGQSSFESVDTNINKENSSTTKKLSRRRTDKAKKSTVRKAGNVVDEVPDKKFASSDPTTDDLDSSSSSKRNSRRVSTMTGKPKIIFTGISDKAVEKIVGNLGGSVVDSVEKATHLVTDKVRRTVKFMCAVAKGIPIVNPDWLINSKSFGMFTEHKTNFLKDVSAEKQYKFQLKTTLGKASEKQLLKGYNIYVTKNVKPEPKAMKEMIECSGGKYISKLGSDKKDVIVISCEEDAAEFEKFIRQGYDVCSNELLLTGILRQELDFEQFRLVNNIASSMDESPQPTRKRKIVAQSTSSKKRKR